MDVMAHDRANWIGMDGHMRVEGKQLDLRDLDEGELSAVHSELATDCDLIRGQLRDAEVEERFVGFLDYERLEWRKRARLAVALKKKQMTAIHAEFARRKTLVPPLADFALPAVCHVLGEEVLGRVMDEARKLHATFVEHQRLRGRAVSDRLEHRSQVCGDKIRHKSEASAEEQIRQMKEGGVDVRDLSVYPCPWCSHYHVGNNPVRKRRRRTRARERLQRMEEQ